MQRRRFIQAFTAAPLAPALLAQQPTETPKLNTAAADDVGETVVRFFTAQQFSALRKLCETIMPPIKQAPGALDAHAPEFLDFLIGESPKERQQLYQTGLDLLNGRAKQKHGKMFVELDAAQITDALAELRAPWTFDLPADPLAHFLREARQDIRTATANSKEYLAGAAQSTGRRGFGGGTGLYWYPLD
jgi:Gluconate 2-dehydrogenase subunit 3